MQWKGPRARVFKRRMSAWHIIQYKHTICVIMIIICAHIKEIKSQKAKDITICIVLYPFICKFRSYKINIIWVYIQTIYWTHWNWMFLMCLWYIFGLRACIQPSKSFCYGKNNKVYRSDIYNMNHGDLDIILFNTHSLCVVKRREVNKKYFVSTVTFF